MKRLLLVPLLALSLPVFAQNAPNPQPSDQGGSAPSTPVAPAHRGGVGMTRFAAADTNGDGRLSRTEAQAIPFASRHFDEIDTNKDGYISPDELRTAYRQMRIDRAARNGAKPGNSTPPPGEDGDETH